MSFQDIKGQSKPIGMLKGYLRSSTLAGAYLFIGPEGIGKHLVAKTFAKTMNCLSQSEDSCDACPSCLKIDKNQHPDIHFIEPLDSEAIKIDYIRQLKKDISLKAYEAKIKVFIINDAHNLTAEAANALLKILEEPPKDSLIILVSAKLQLMFKTIVSRCQIVKFYPLKRTELEEILKKDYSLDKDAAHFLAYFSEGRLGRAFRLKDTDILRDKNRLIDEFTILKKLRFTQNFLPKDREELRGYLNILASWFRDIYLVKIGMPSSELINLDRKIELLKFMHRYTFLGLDEILNFISDSFLYLEQNVNIKLLLSNLRMELCQEHSR